MPRRRHLPFATPVALYFALGAALLMALPYGEEITSLNAWRTPQTMALASLLTRLGEAWAYGLAALALLYWNYRHALFVAVTGLVVLPVTFLLKHWFAVPRPITFFQQAGREAELALPPGVDLHSGLTSFPSGHTLAAFALYTALALITPHRYRYLGIAWAALAVVTAFTRILLAQHFLRDVLFGALLGIALAYGLWRLWRARLNPR